MNTHDTDIEMPAEFRSGNDIPVTQATIKRERMEEILIAAIEADRKRRDNDQQPFGYFRAGPFGWTDCAATDDGAIALYERPQVQGEPVAYQVRCGVGEDWYEADQQAYQLVRSTRPCDARALYLAPQPAEPTRDGLPRHVAQTLADAIYKAAQKMGIANGDHSTLSVPQCLHLLDCMSQPTEPVKYCTHPICRGAGTTCTGVCSERFAAPQPAEPVKHPSYDSDCCQGHKSESDCRCAAYDAEPVKIDVDDLAQEIRRVDGKHSLGAAALAEALLPFLSRTAEPVKVPSNAISVVGVPEFDALMDHIYENGTASEGVLPLANAFARALLARYGQPAQPSVPEPLKYGREWKDHYVTGWNNCRATMLAAEQAQQDDPTPEEEEAWQRMEKTNE